VNKAQAELLARLLEQRETREAIFAFAEVQVQRSRIETVRAVNEGGNPAGPAAIAKYFEEFYLNAKNIAEEFLQ